MLLIYINGTADSSRRRRHDLSGWMNLTLRMEVIGVSSAVIDITDNDVSEVFKNARRLQVAVLQHP